MQNRTKSKVSDKAARQRQGGGHTKPRVNISSQKLGFFRWRTSLPTLRSSEHVSRAKNGRGSAFLAGDDAAPEERTLEEQRLIESIPKTTSFLQLSSVDPFTSFPGPEDAYLVQEVLDHARNSFWLNLFVTRHPSETPHPGFQGKSTSPET